MKKIFTLAVVLFMCLGMTQSQIINYIEWGSKSDPDGIVDIWKNSEVKLFNHTKFGINYIQFKSSDLDENDQTGYIVFPAKDSRTLGSTLKADIEICCKVDGVWSGDFDLLMTNSFTGDPRTTTWSTISANMMNGKSDWTSADWNMRLIPTIEFDNPNASDVVFAIKIHDTRSNNKAVRIYAVKIYDPLATGVEDNILQTTSIYPNPTSKFIYVDNNSNGSKISVCDITGNYLLQEVALISNRVDVSQLQPGHYFLVIEKDGIKKVVKFLKK